MLDYTKKTCRELGQEITTLEIYTNNQGFGEKRLPCTQKEKRK